MPRAAAAAAAALASAYVRRSNCFGIFNGTPLVSLGAAKSYSGVTGDSGVRWVFLGPPGVGKGTYASRVAAALSVPHIAAGDLVRAEIKSGSQLGQEVHA